ncbi:MAG: leucine--tRNA ligase [Candidatus Pacebacteria bacterium]|nr:leucine--tRNA ligase [Candidatus Paceibacterota bacterium]
MREYDHKAIEKKWQDEWTKHQIYKTPKTDRPKQYILDMFPYPSGSGLHVGHVEGYTATDIYSRFKRMQGYAVLHPMGWDAFGLPAENYAIKTGTPPQTSTDAAIVNFRKQIQALGLSYDWDREVGAHNPDYYRWTQWFFLFLFKNGLAEKRMARVNWCPKDQTVLANEQTVSEDGVKGVCVRCGTPVEQKELSQWFFKITEFADDLVKDLDTVDWPESTKINQRNWIGRKEGVVVPHVVSGTDLTLHTFSAYPAWLFADTFIVIAPEHPLVPALVQGTEAESAVMSFVAAAQKKTTEERGDSKEKLGIFTGRYAEDPFRKGEKMPIWIANFALMDFGTGVIRCSSHDARDYEFAQKYEIPLRHVVGDGSFVDAHDNAGVLIDSGPFTGRTISPELIVEMIDWMVSHGIAERKVTYRLRDWLISRQRYWGAPIPVVYDPSGVPHPVPEEHLPWMLPTDVEYQPKGSAPLGTSQELIERTERIFGPGWKPEIDTMDTFVCSSWYFFRFADAKNSNAFASPEAIAAWVPVDLYVGGAEHTVLHLMYARFFTKALKRFGYVSFDEPFLKLRHQGTILAEDGTKMSKSKGNVINPDDVVELYGADTVRMYEMFMGPLEAMKPWNTKGIIGPRRFLERVWRLTDKVGDGALGAAEAVFNQTIKKVGDDIQTFGLNTAISQLMICLNAFEELPVVPRAAFETYLKLLAPFAPHLTEELWHELGHTTSIHLESWPTYDDTKLMADTVVIAVQVAGKTRGTVSVSHGASQEQVLAVAERDLKLAQYLPQTPSRVIFVPNKILNLVP